MRERAGRVRASLCWQLGELKEAAAYWGIIPDREQVTYFKKRRVMEHQRDATIKKLSAEGATGMNVSSGAGSAR